jgi:hypothetical protein
MITANPPAVKIAAAVVTAVTLSLDRRRDCRAPHQLGKLRVERNAGLAIGDPRQAVNLVAFPSKVDVLAGIV